MKRATAGSDRLPGRGAWPLPSDCDGIPMQTRAWMTARCGLVPHEQLHVVAVPAVGEPTAVAALRRRGGWLRELPAMWEPSDVTWSSPDSLDELASALASQPLPVHFERLPADSPTLAALRRAYARRGRIIVRPTMPTPYIDLDERWRDETTCFSSRRRADFRRAERRAGEFGELSYEIRSPRTESELAALLDDAFDVEARSWKEREGSSLAAEAWMGEFFRRFARDALPTGMLRFAFVRIDGRAVAMQIAVEWRDRFWLLKISHDEDHARCSPGQLMMRHTLLHAGRSGLRSYEFLGLMADWTRMWTDQAREHVEVRALPLSVATCGALSVDAGRSLLRRARSRPARRRERSS